MRVATAVALSSIGKREHKDNSQKNSSVHWICSYKNTFWFSIAILRALAHKSITWFYSWMHKIRAKQFAQKEIEIFMGFSSTLIKLDTNQQKIKSKAEFHNNKNHIQLMQNNIRLSITKNCWYVWRKEFLDMSAAAVAQSTGIEAVENRLALKWKKSGMSGKHTKGKSATTSWSEFKFSTWECV